MTERIEQLRAEAESAIRAAPSADALEELRVRYLGRKAELPQMLRGVPSSRPPSAAPSARRPTRRARQLEALIERARRPAGRR